ncbi:MAG TPA: carboxypeptidase regulatory-like domain-containing protein [Burkholderiales bacterium]|nr:carboxypeptidase regulatory-like domain-containing protein [Burkholderiales bacterium]
MVSPRRREVIIAGLATVVAPAALAALPAAPEKLILSGRVLGTHGRPLAGATVAAGAARAVTDADGRFLLLTTTRMYGVTCEGRSTEGFVSNQRRSADGTWRATVALTLV